VRRGGARPYAHAASHPGGQSARYADSQVSRAPRRTLHSSATAAGGGAGVFGSGRPIATAVAADARW
jgi:hypothetical protein